LGCNLIETVGHLLSEQHSVWQVSQRIMLRHVCHACLSFVVLSNILIGDYPTAMLHWAVIELDDAAVT
jgi:hypothetical protein